jgi:hypothetical protein
MLSEFLESFAIVGHTIEGKRFVLIVTPTEVDRDALGQLMASTTNTMLDDDSLKLVDNDAGDPPRPGEEADSEFGED